MKDEVRRLPRTLFIKRGFLFRVFSSHCLIYSCTIMKLPRSCIHLLVMALIRSFDVFYVSACAVDSPKHYCGTSLSEALFSVCKKRRYSLPLSSKVNTYRMYSSNLKAYSITRLCLCK